MALTIMHLVFLCAVYCVPLRLKLLPSQGDFSYSPTGFSIFDVDKAIVQLL
jgi:hypothetical protein